MGGFSRRTVLAVSGGAAVALLAGARAAGTTTRGTPRLHRSRFLPLVGTRFRLEADGRASAVRLDAIRDLPASSAGDDLAYSLLFRPLTGPEPAAGIRLLRAPGLDPVALFLAPVDHGAALRLQAVINQRVPR